MRTNRYIHSLVALMLTALLVLVSCQKDDESIPTIISLDENVISLVMGTSQTLIPTIVPPASTSDVIWSSSNPEVATVNAQGLVQAIGMGNAVINAKIGSSTSFCDVFVTDEAVPVRGIFVNKSILEMRMGDVEKLLTEFDPIDATNRRKRWSSSNENVVSVHEINGTLTAHSYGDAVITVTTLDGDYTASCTVSVLPIIELLSPSEQNITLRPAEIDRKIAFTWNDIEGIDQYILKISTTDRFAEDDIVYSATTSENRMDVPEFDLNEAIIGIPGSLARLYWTIESGTAGIRVLPATGRLNLISDRREFLLLAPASATGMQLQKMEDAYHYAITTSGQATVNTVALKNSVHIDSAVVSIMYKSNRALTPATVRFFNASGALRGTVQQDIPAASEWKEWRLLQPELPAGWGSAGDYIQFDFGSTSGYQIEVNAIHMTNLTLAEQKAMYTPEIILMQSFNSHMTVLVNQPNYYKFTITGTDSNGNTVLLTKKLPAGAVILSFEYKSSGAIANNLQVFLGGSGLSEAKSIRAGQVPANPTDEWKEHQVDMTTLRGNYPEWGVPNQDFMRIDFGEGGSIGVTMEIRNIQFKFK